MKLKSLFLLLVISLVCSISLSAQCAITNLIAEAYVCNEQGEIYFDIAFDVTNPGNDNQFTVLGNGNNYGTFQYGDEFYTVGPFIADCETAAELIITDLNNEDCQAVWEFDEIFCCDQGDCQMTTLDFQNDPICQDGLILSEWLIAGINLSESGFDVYVNDVFETFIQYSDNDNYAFDIVDPETEFFTLKICDNDNADCCIESVLENPCFEQGNDMCAISNLIAEAYVCNEQGEIYFDIAFDVTNPGNDNQFTVLGNGNNYGTFEYGDEFYTVGPFLADCEAAAELIITDVNNEDCQAVWEFDEIFCCDQGECDISVFEAEVSECNDGLFNVTISVETTGATSEVFDLWIGGELYETFSFNNLPVTITGLSFDSQGVVLQVFDGDNDGCSALLEILNPCFEQGNDMCAISNFIAEAYVCNEQGEIYFDIAFDITNPGNDNQFTVLGNGNNYGTFEYGDEFYTVGPFIADCETAAELIITDVNNEDCQAVWEFDEIFCCDQGECDISVFEAEVSECNDGLFNVTISVETTGATSEVFDLWIGGELYKTYSFNNLPVTITGLSFDSQGVALQVFDGDNDGCTALLEILNPCFEQGNDMCQISEVSAEFIECNDEGMAFFHLSFNYENTGDDHSFTVRGNGQNYGTFEYGLDFYSIGPVIADCETELEFIVTDLNNENCSAFTEHDPACCDEEGCSLFELYADATECLDDNTFNLNIDVEVVGTTNDFFDLYIEDEFFNYYEFADLPLLIEDLTFDSEILTIQVCENDHPDCCLAVEIENPCMDGGNQENYIDDIAIEFVNCEDNMITMSMDFEYGDNNSQFEVTDDQKSYGIFNYSDLPITIDNIVADGVTDYTFVVTDMLIDGLYNSIHVGILSCDGSIVLDIDDISLDPKDIKSIKAYDITGRYLGQSLTLETLKILDTDHCIAPGIIILRIDYGTKVVTKKIVRVY